MEHFFPLFKDLSITLLLIPPQIFVFSVTLLGNAIENSQQEEKIARENEIAEIYEKIENLMSSAKEAKRTRDTGNISEQLNTLSVQQKMAKKKIGQIRSKYERINFKNLVIIPSTYLFMAFFLDGFVVPLLHISTPVLIIMMFINVVFLFLSLRKAYLALALIQEISANKKESQHYVRIKEVIVSALRQNKEEDKSEALVEFNDIKFPLSVSPNSERKLTYGISLKNGNGLEDVYIWFYLPDSFKLIEPSEDTSWRQTASSFAPNYKTVKIKVKDLVPTISNIGSIKFTVPDSGGSYSVWYQVTAKGYSSDREEMTFMVNK